MYAVLLAGLVLMFGFNEARHEGRSTRQGTATVRGRVIDRDTAQPLPRFRVSLSKQPLQDESSPTLSTGITDAHGRYEMAGVPPGAYVLTARPPRFVASHLAQMYGEGDPVPRADAARHQAVELRANDTFPADFAMRRSLAIEGRVATEDGDPLAGLLVSVEPLDGRAMRSRLETDDRGFYRHFGLAPGRYRVCAAPVTGGPLLPTCYPAESDPGRAAAVALTSDDARSVDIVMRSSRRFSVSGDLQDSAGGALDGGVVSFVEENARPRRSVPVQRIRPGRFVVSGVEPGTYTLRLELAADGSGRPRESASMEVVVSGSDIDGVVLRARRAAVVAGVVTFEDASTPPGAASMIVTAQQEPAPGVEPSATFASQPVRQNLTFELPQLSGPVRVGLSNAPAGWIVKSVFFHGRNVTDDALVLEPSSDPRAIEVVLTSRVGHIAGTAAGSAAGRAVVVLAFQAGKVGLAARPDASGGSSLPVAASAPADDRGTFRMGPLAPGDYLVAAVDRNDWFDASLENRSAAIDRILPRAERVRVGEGDPVSIALRIVAVK